MIFAQNSLNSSFQHFVSIRIFSTSIIPINKVNLDCKNEPKCVKIHF